MNQFKELNVWQKGRELVKDIYKANHNYPKDELFGITSQMRRAAVSIPANIAKGCGRNTDADLNRFDEKLNDFQRMIFGFKKSLNLISKPILNT